MRDDTPRGLVRLLAGLIDYAGLFPPAALPMADAVARYARYRQGAHAWALGRFIVPAARLEEFARTLDAVESTVSAEAPWPVSVLADWPLPPTFAQVGTFASAVADARGSSRSSARSLVPTTSMPWRLPRAGSRRLARCRSSRSPSIC